MKNEILISYKMIEAGHVVSYVVTDSNTYQLLRGEYETDSGYDPEVQWNLFILVLRSLDLDLNKVEIERGFRKIWVRY